MIILLNFILIWLSYKLSYTETEFTLKTVSDNIFSQFMEKLCYHRKTMETQK